MYSSSRWLNFSSSSLRRCACSARWSCCSASGGSCPTKATCIRASRKLFFVVSFRRKPQAPTFSARWRTSSLRSKERATARVPGALSRIHAMVSKPSMIGMCRSTTATATWAPPCTARRYSAPCAACTTTRKRASPASMSAKALRNSVWSSIKANGMGEGSMWWCIKFSTTAANTMLSLPHHPPQAPR